MMGPANNCFVPWSVARFANAGYSWGQAITSWQGLAIQALCQSGESGRLPYAFQDQCLSKTHGFVLRGI